MVWSNVVVLIGLGNERASTPSFAASQKLKHEIWLAMTDIGEEKSPLYIFIYADRADRSGSLENIFASGMRC